MTSRAMRQARHEYDAQYLRGTLLGAAMPQFNPYECRSVVDIKLRRDALRLYLNAVEVGLGRPTTVDQDGLATVPGNG